MTDFATISPHLNVRISPRARRLTLRLDAQARKVHLIVPKRASMKAAYQFAYLNRNWIDEKLATLPEPIPYHDGALLPILGRQYRLTIDHDEMYKVTKVRFEDDRLVVRTSLDNITPRLHRFFKKLATETFSPIAHAKAKEIGKKITYLNLKDMRTRWGSCSTDGRMSLNWRLIFSPPETYDYVIAHEVAHLTHSNHGKNFWNLCEKISADFHTGSAWIRMNGQLLARYGADITPAENFEE